MVLIVSIESFYVDQQQNEGSPLIVVKSHTRDIKLQCTSKESHEKWVQVSVDMTWHDGLFTYILSFDTVVELSVQRRRKAGQASEKQAAFFTTGNGPTSDYQAKEIMANVCCQHRRTSTTNATWAKKTKTTFHDQVCFFENKKVVWASMSSILWKIESLLI